MLAAVVVVSSLAALVARCCMAGPGVVADGGSSNPEPVLLVGVQELGVDGMSREKQLHNHD